MAKAMEISPSTVGRIRREHRLEPHLSRTFEVSNDPHFDKSWRTSSGSTWLRPSMPWLSAATTTCRLSIAPNRDCR